MTRKLLLGAVALLLVGSLTPPAHAQQRRAELARLHNLCEQGYRPACIRFGYMLGENRGRQAEWRREHPNWWWWQPYIR